MNAGPRDLIIAPYLRANIPGQRYELRKTFDDQISLEGAGCGIEGGAINLCFEDQKIPGVPYVFRFSFLFADPVERDNSTSVMPP